MSIGRSAIGPPKTHFVSNVQIAELSDAEGRMIDPSTQPNVTGIGRRIETRYKVETRSPARVKGSVGVEFDRVVSGLEIALRDHTVYPRLSSSLTRYESW